MKIVARRPLWLAAICLVLVGLILACGTPDEADQASAEATTAPVTQPTSTSVAVATLEPVASGFASLGISDAKIVADGRTPFGSLTVGLHYGHSPKWLDPQEYASPVWNHFIYIVHDAMMKPMAGNVWTYSLAEYAEMPEDFTYAKFRLRDGLKFQDGTALTTEDVKWSYENYRGVHATTLKDNTSSIEIVDDRNIVFHFNAPFLDFMDLYTVVSGAAWVMPRAYYEEMGAEGFRQKPMGAGPFKFVSMSAGSEMEFEAWEGYWRKVPRIKTLTILGLGNPAGQWAAIHTGELDVAYLTPGKLWPEVFENEDLQWNKNFTSPWHLFFPGYNDPDSPFNDKRVREAVSLSFNREFINLQEIQGLGVLTGNWIGPDTPDALLTPGDLPIPEFNPEKAKQLLAEAGYAEGLEIDWLVPFAPFYSKGERILTDLASVGIVGEIQILEGPGYREKASKGADGWPGGRTIVENISNNPGNAAHYLSRYAICDSPQSFICEPVIEEMWAKYQASIDVDERRQLNQDIQRYLIEEFLVVPIYINSFLHVAGPNVIGNMDDYYQMPQAWGPWPFEEWEVKE